MQRIKRNLFTYEVIGVYHAYGTDNVTEMGEITVCHVTDNNVADALSFQSQEYIECFRKFLKHGDSGYYAYLNNKCVHRIWVVHEGNVSIHSFYSIALNSKQVYIHWGETAIWARGCGVFPKALGVIKNEHRDSEILVAINEKNISSRRGAEKAGFIIKERIKVLVVLGIKHIKVENIIHNVHSGGDKGTKIIYCGVLFVPQRIYVEVAA